MSSRNLGILIVLACCVAVAYLLGKNQALQESLTEAQQQTARQSLVANSPTPTATPTIQPSRKATIKPTADEIEEQAKAKAESKPKAQPIATPREQASTETATKPPCVIIGNVNSGIYHLPGCASYNRIAPRNRRYYCTEEEAQKAGYRKARNC